MKRKDTRTERLSAIQKVFFDKDHSDFKEAMLAVGVIESEILELQTKLNEAPLDMGIDASELPYWSRHNIWVESRIVSLSQNLATARAIAEERKQQLSRSNGRLEVLKKLKDSS